MVFLRRNRMFQTNKIEVIPFKDFMCGRPATPIQKKTPLLPVYSFLPPFTIKSLLPVGIDPTFTIFVIAGASVAVLALFEYMLAEFGFTEISDIMGTTFKFAFPVVGYGTILWFLSTL
jgi:hypothetical protein